jgi:hypothetical protein
MLEFKWNMFSYPKKIYFLNNNCNAENIQIWQTLIVLLMHFMLNKREYFVIKKQSCILTRLTDINPFFVEPAQKNMDRSKRAQNSLALVEFNGLCEIYMSQAIAEISHFRKCQGN